MEFKWFAIMVIGVAFCGSLMMFAGGEKSSAMMETNQMRRERYAHEIEMAKLQQLKMPTDSCIVIDGVRYKLVKQ